MAYLYKVYVKFAKSNTPSLYTKGYQQFC